MCNGDSQPLLDNVSDRSDQKHIVNDDQNDSKEIESPKNILNNIRNVVGTPNTKRNEKAICASVTDNDTEIRDPHEGKQNIGVVSPSAVTFPSLLKKEKSLPDLKEEEKARERANSLQRHNSERLYKEEPEQVTDRPDYDVEAQVYDPAGFSEC